MALRRGEKKNNSSTKNTKSSLLVHSGTSVAREDKFDLQS